MAPLHSSIMTSSSSQLTPVRVLSASIVASTVVMMQVEQPQQQQLSSSKYTSPIQNKSLSVNTANAALAGVSVTPLKKVARPIPLYTIQIQTNAPSTERNIGPSLTRTHSYRIEKKGEEFEQLYWKLKKGEPHQASPVFVAPFPLPLSSPTAASPASPPATSPTGNSSTGISENAACLNIWLHSLISQLNSATNLAHVGSSSKLKPGSITLPHNQILVLNEWLQVPKMKQEQAWEQSEEHGSVGESKEEFEEEEEDDEDEQQPEGWIDENITAPSSSSLSLAAAPPSAPNTPPIGLHSFELLRVIGKGSFGKVMLVRKNDSQKIYAMKTLEKEHVVKRNQVAHTKTERSVMGSIKHPFIVSLRFAFQSPRKLYFVMDYKPGGELFHHLGCAGRFSEHRARFYAAQIVLALEYLHAKAIIYRDLKPENVLLDAKGFATLTDFGLSKENVMDNISAHSFCGTPEYLAPEILTRSGHGRAADWWSLGALLYEMLTGMPPFYSRTRERLFAKILNSELRIPRFFSKGASSLLQGLLDRNPETRLGSSPSDAQEIKEHEFFKDIDFEKMANKKIKPPFAPVVKNLVDTGNFDSEFTNMPIESAPNASAHPALAGAATQTSAANPAAGGAPGCAASPTPVRTDANHNALSPLSPASPNMGGGDTDDTKFMGFTYVNPSSYSFSSTPLSTSFSFLSTSGNRNASATGSTAQQQYSSASLNNVGGKF